MGGPHAPAAGVGAGAATGSARDPRVSGDRARGLQLRQDTASAAGTITAQAPGASPAPVGLTPSPKLIPFFIID